MHFKFQEEKIKLQFFFFLIFFKCKSIKAEWSSLGVENECVFFFGLIRGMIAIMRMSSVYKVTETTHDEQFKYWEISLPNSKIHSQRAREVHDEIYIKNIIEWIELNKGHTCLEWTERESEWYLIEWNRQNLDMVHRRFITVAPQKLSEWM